MGMVCPQCNTRHEQCLQCPLCGTRLLYGDPCRSAERPSGPPAAGSIRRGDAFSSASSSPRACSMGCFAFSQPSCWRCRVRRRSSRCGRRRRASFCCRECASFSLLGGAVLAGVGQRQGLFLGAIVGVLERRAFGPVPARSRAASHCRCSSRTTAVAGRHRRGGRLARLDVLEASAGRAPGAAAPLKRVGSNPP